MATLVINHTGKINKAALSSLISFLDKSDKPYSHFKPGQTSLERDYYANVTQEHADGNKCLQNFQRFGSDYNKGVSTAVKPGDYKVPSKDANNLIEYDLMNKPELFQHTRRAKYEPNKTSDMLAKAGQSAVNPTSHWKTNSQQTNETQMNSRFSASERPVWSYNRQAYSSKRGYFQTEF